VGTKTKSLRRRTHRTANGVIGSKMAEEKLSLSREDFRDFCENANDLIQSVDANGGFVYVNRKWLQTLGYSEVEVNSLKLNNVLREDQIPHCMEFFIRVCSGESLDKVETVFVSKGSREIHVEGNVSPRFRDGEFLSTIGIFRDVTERKKAEETLSQATAQWQDTFDAIEDLVMIIDKEFRVVRANRAMRTAFPGTNVLGMHCYELLHGTERPIPNCPCYQAFRSGAVTRHEFAEQHLDGRLFDASSYPINYKDGTIKLMVHVVRDITERKRAEKEKQRLEQQLQLAGRLAAVGELAAGVAHELNNPLAIVQAYSQLLSDRDDLDETAKSDVETIYGEAQRASRITSNLLSFARQHNPEKNLTSINEAIEASLEVYTHWMNVNKINPVLELAPDLPKTLADFHQMQQVFVNLISNATQAMTEAHSGGNLLIKTQKVGEMIRVTCTDDGPGIPEEVLKRLFDPFFTTKDVGKGTGLGLSICYGIVQGHGGQMSVKSKVEEGTTFVVEIPVVSEISAIEETDSTHYLRSTPHYM